MSVKWSPFRRKGGRIVASHIHTPVIKALRPFLALESIHLCPLCQKEFCGSMGILFEVTPQGLQEAAALLKQIASGIAADPPVIESDPSASKKTTISITHASVASEHGTLPITGGFITIDGQQIPLTLISSSTSGSHPPSAEQREPLAEQANQSGEPLPLYPSWNILKDLQSHHIPHTIEMEEQAEAEDKSQDD